MKPEITHPPIDTDEFADETFEREEFLRKTAGGVRYIRGGHLAYDLQARKNRTLYAPCDGRLAHVAFGPALGRHQFVVRTKASLLRSGWFFAHADACRVEDGATVKAGDAVGTLGSSGLPSPLSAHLHLEYLDPWNDWAGVRPGTAIDPGPALQACKEADMALSDADKEWIRDTVREMVSRGIFSLLNGRRDPKIWTPNMSQELQEALSHNNKAIHGALTQNSP